MKTTDIITKILINKIQLMISAIHNKNLMKFPKIIRFIYKVKQKYFTVDDMTVVLSTSKNFSNLHNNAKFIRLIMALDIQIQRNFRRNSQLKVMMIQRYKIKKIKLIVIYAKMIKVNII